MKKKRRKQPRHRLLKACCVGAGLLSISNPTQITAADIGLYDVHNSPVAWQHSKPVPERAARRARGRRRSRWRRLRRHCHGPWQWRSGQSRYACGHIKQSWTISPSSQARVGFADASVRVATGDLDGDGKDEIIVTPATGPGSEARASSGQGRPLARPQDFHVVDSTDGMFDGFAGGVNVAVGDYEGDGVPDIVAAKGGCSRRK